MGNKFILAGAVALTLAAGGIAQASDIAEVQDIVPAANDELVTYKQVGDWTVIRNKTRGDCLTERTFPDGFAMQLGLTKGGEYAYVGIFTKRPIEVAEGDNHIDIAIDGKRFGGKSFGVKGGALKGGWHGGYVVSSDPKFVYWVINGWELVAFPSQTDNLFKIDLTGTKRAIQTARECLKTS